MTPALQLVDTLKSQARQFLASDHPWRISHYRDALNVAAHLQDDPESVGMLTHALDAIQFFKTQLSKEVA